MGGRTSSDSVNEITTERFLDDGIVKLMKDSRNKWRE